jgi:SAM-dependent methyltransferase
MVPEASDPSTFWEHIHRYRFASRWVRNKRVLDIASGEGYGTRGLLEVGAKHVVGVDIDPEACEHAARKYGLEVRQGSAEHIPLDDNSVDVVVSFETVEHVPNPERFIQEIFRVLLPGGTVIISTPETNLYNPDGMKHNPYHCSEMTAQQFQNLLGSAFSKIRLFGQRPATAKWWSPICLISESCPWERLPKLRGIRRRLWARWNPERVNPVSEADRENPVNLISSGKTSWLKRTLNWSAVRPIRRSEGWSPVFLIAVAQKEK